MTQNGTAAQVKTRNGIAVGDVVLYSGGFGERPYEVSSSLKHTLAFIQFDSGKDQTFGSVYTAAILPYELWEQVPEKFVKK